MHFELDKHARPIGKAVSLLFLLTLSLFLTGCSDEIIVLPRDFSSIDGEFKLNDPVEDDLRFPVSVIKVRGSKAPEISEYFLQFDDRTEEEAYLTMQLPHSRQANSTIQPHFHWQSEDNSAGNVVWCVSYSCANIYDDFPNFQTSCTISQSMEDVTTHLMSPMIEINNSLSSSAMCKMRIYRDATATADTYGQDANLMEFDVHVYKDKLGENR